MAGEELDGRTFWTDRHVRRVASSFAAARVTSWIRSFVRSLSKEAFDRFFAVTLVAFLRFRNRGTE